MNRPPLIAVALTAAGVIPFIVGTGLALNAPWALNFAKAVPWAMPRSGADFLIHYGIVILSFMTGVFWGFATQAEDRHRTLAYTLSVIPALYAFFFVAGTPTQQLTALTFGFIGLLGFDGIYAWMGLAPAWWRSLRLPVTFAVVLALGTAIRGL